MEYPIINAANEEEESRIKAVMDELAKSKIGKQLIEDAVEHKTTVAFDGAMRAYGSYDEVKNHLRLNPTSSHDRLVGTAAHELRHAQQFQKGILLDALLDTPKTYIQNQAAIEADASATSCAVCYELAMQGNDKPLESLREKDPHFVNPFQNAAINGGLENGEAYKAAFKGWFTDYCTRDSYDCLYIKMVRQRKSNCTREEEDKAFMREVPVNDVVQKVCTCNGKPYLSEKETQEFFSTEDSKTVSFERFNNIYANCYRPYKLDYSKDQNDEMKSKLDLVMRPHFNYMPKKVVPEVQPLPTIENRQAAAAEKIAEKKENRDKKTVINPAVLKAKAGMSK